MKRRTFLKGAATAASTSKMLRAGEGKRIAFGGIQIECSTYSGIRTRLEDFTVKRGQELADDPFFRQLKEYPYAFHPALLATAVPGPPVEPEAYNRLKTEFLRRLADLLPLDGLSLAMHGAMYVVDMQDADGDWIAAARKAVGEGCLITASFDLHGSLSRRAIDNLDMLSAFRTAPHIDREETAKRACDMLVHCLDHRIRPTLVWSPIPVLMPGERTSTVYEPAKHLWAQLPGMNAEPGVLDASLLVGYVWADEPRATASAVLTGTKPDLLEKDALSLAQQYWDARKEFQFKVPTGSLADCIERARALGDETGGDLRLGRQSNRRGRRRPGRRAGRTPEAKRPRCRYRRHRGSACNRGVLPRRRGPFASPQDRRCARPASQQARGSLGESGLPIVDR